MKYSIKRRPIGTRFFYIGLLFIMIGCTGTYYVSNSGSDSNNGKSMSSPWQSLAKVNSASLHAGNTVLFKSGDAWYGQLVPRSGRSSFRITYGAYGTGDKPLIHASITKMDTSDWVYQGSHTWRSAEPYSKEIGNIYLNGSFCGVRMYSEDDLTAQGQFYYNPSTKYLIIYSKENPANHYSDLKLLSAVILVPLTGKSNITIRDLNLSYTSGYAVVGNDVSHITLRNLTMTWIGGQTYQGKIRKGNAVEFWNNCKDALVENCTIAEVFDAGLSNQGDSAIQSNITYRNNLITHCEYSYEYFLQKGEASNILFENNTCVDAGLGWGHTQRPDPSGRHIRIAGTPPHTFNFVVRNNIFSNALDVLNYARDIEGLEDRFTFDYNAYYQPSDNNLARIKMVDYPSFSAYQSSSGWDAHSMNKDPLFVNAAKGDYRLSPHSPCLKASKAPSTRETSRIGADLKTFESKE